MPHPRSARHRRSRRRGPPSHASAAWPRSDLQQRIEHAVRTARNVVLRCVRTADAGRRSRRKARDPHPLPLRAGQVAFCAGRTGRSSAYRVPARGRSDTSTRRMDCQPGRPGRPSARTGLGPGQQTSVSGLAADAYEPPGSLAPAAVCRPGSPPWCGVVLGRRRRRSVLGLAPSGPSPSGSCSRRRRSRPRG
jgi:hypothetical protein